MLQITPTIEKTGPLAAQDVIEPKGFVRGIIDFLDDVSYKLMTSEDDLEQVCRMRHDAYVEAGHMKNNGSGIFRDEMDGLPGTDNVGVFLNGKLACCIRVHKLDVVHRHACAMETYAHVLDPILDSGIVCVDTSRFCNDIKLASRYKGLPLAAMRVTGMAAKHHEAKWIISTITAPHINFYKKVLGSEDWSGGGIKYPTLEATVHLVSADHNELKRMAHINRQYFLSTSTERNALFNSGEFVKPSVRDVIEKGISSGYWN